MFTCTKTYENLPCAHRQWRHEGNCALIHGYSRAFKFHFGAEQRDKCGFIVDFGDLGWLKDYLEYNFDHTLLIQKDDPHLALFEALPMVGAGALRLVESTSTEGMAEMVWMFADSELRKRTKGRCWVIAVECLENNKNSAVFHNLEAGFKGWTE